MHSSLGLDAELLVPEEKDIPLPERCRRVNAWCRQLGKDNVILISIHANAAGCAFLLSEEGQQALVDLHVDGIISHLDSL